jgi:hypothetical protein
MARSSDASVSSDDADEGNMHSTTTPQLLRTTAAFYQWRHARLKAAYKQQLQSLLADVVAEEQDTQRLHAQLQCSQEQ